jgi:hypothetical protein
LKRKRKYNPELLNDELKFREFVMWKLGQHDMALKILLILSGTTLSLLILVLKLVL